MCAKATGCASRSSKRESAVDREKRFPVGAWEHEGITKPRGKTRTKLEPKPETRAQAQVKASAQRKMSSTIKEKISEKLET